MSVREASVGKRLGRGGLTIAWSWLAIVTAYMVWSAASERGLYGLLMRWQIERGDSYSGTFTFALPLVLLAGPSLWTLFGHFIAVEHGARGRPELARRYARAWAFGLLGTSGALLLLGFIGIAMVLRQPSDPPPVDIDATVILAGQAPAGPLHMMVHPVRHARYEVTELGRRGASATTIWQGVRPQVGPVRLGEADPTIVDPAEPVAIFSEGSIHRSLANPDPSPGRHGRRILIRGHVVTNGLPDFARLGLVRQGVRIAEPHYVVADRPRGFDWTLTAGLGLFGATILGLIGGVLLLHAEGKLGLP